jgi:hypothetical protein
MFLSALLLSERWAALFLIDLYLEYYLSLVIFR